MENVIKIAGLIALGVFISSIFLLCLGFFLERVDGFFECALSRAEIAATKALGRRMMSESYWFNKTPALRIALYEAGAYISKAGSYDAHAIRVEILKYPEFNKGKTHDSNHQR